MPAACWSGDSLSPAQKGRWTIWSSALFCRLRRFLAAALFAEGGEGGFLARALFLAKLQLGGEDLVAGKEPHSQEHADCEEDHLIPQPKEEEGVVAKHHVGDGHEGVGEGDGVDQEPRHRGQPVDIGQQADEVGDHHHHHHRHDGRLGRLDVLRQGAQEDGDGQRREDGGEQLHPDEEVLPGGEGEAQGLQHLAGGVLAAAPHQLAHVARIAHHEHRRVEEGDQPRGDHLGGEDAGALDGGREEGLQGLVIFLVDDGGDHHLRGEHQQQKDDDGDHHGLAAEKAGHRARRHLLGVFSHGGVVLCLHRLQNGARVGDARLLHQGAGEDRPQLLHHLAVHPGGDVGGDGRALDLAVQLDLLGHRLFGQDPRAKPLGDDDGALPAQLPGVVDGVFIGFRGAVHHKARLLEPPQQRPGQLAVVQVDDSHLARVFGGLLGDRAHKVAQQHKDARAEDDGEDRLQGDHLPQLFFQKDPKLSHRPLTALSNTSSRFCA